MGGAYSIIAINMALGLALLGAMIAVCLHDRSRSAPPVITLAIAVFIAAGAMELLAPAVAEGEARLFRVVQHMTNFLACILLTLGVWMHYGLKTPRRWVILYTLAGFALTVAIVDMPRDAPLRIALNQMPLVLVLLAGVLRLAFAAPSPLPPGRASRGPNWLRWLVVASLAVFTLNNASRPFLLWLTGTMGSSPADYHDTLYALVSQFQHAIATMVTGVVILIALVTDVVANLRYRSGLDPLTGLFNRSGFELAARGALDEAQSGTRAGIGAKIGSRVGSGVGSGVGDDTVPVTLLLVEADGLASIVDRYGPQIGDEVIRALAALLRAEIRRMDVPARLDGARFALLLWNADDPAACEAAEARRRIFPALASDILPEGETLSVSFGVARHDGTETVAALLDRATAALRRARRLGGDRVVSTRDLDRFTIVEGSNAA